MLSAGLLNAETEQKQTLPDVRKTNSRFTYFLLPLISNSTQNICFTQASMRFFIDYKFPEPAFWLEYEQLWNESISRSAFQSPHFIRYLAKRHEPDLAVVQYWANDQLRGAAFFKKEHKVYRFLSDARSDHNFFILHRDCDGEEVAAFFESFFEEIRQERWKLALEKQPADAPYKDVMVNKGRASRLFWTQSFQSVCPLLREASPEALSDSLVKSKKAHRNIKALAKQQSIDFEVFFADEDLESWAAEFCSLHVSRWAGTSTPSRYEQPGEQEFLLACMHEWIKDGVLVRFSLRLGGQRVAYCWGFIQEKIFIAHAQAYDAAFSKNSPIKVLINYIGQWFRTQELTAMDFGYGGDEYKYAYANYELKLESYFVTTWWNIPFFLKAKASQVVRQNPRLHRFLRTKVKPILSKVSTLQPT